MEHMQSRSGDEKNIGRGLATSSSLQEKQGRSQAPGYPGHGLGRDIYFPLLTVATVPLFGTV
jgi:hypothetical protein